MLAQLRAEAVAAYANDRAHDYDAEPHAHALRFDHFMRIALYAPEIGYYAHPGRARVGRGPGSDFYTSSTIGQTRQQADRPARAPAASAPATTSTAPADAPPSNSPSLFGELVAQSCLALMGDAFCAQATFIEIGAEHGRGILENLAHPFAATRTLSLGQALSLKSPPNSPLIVFSNELFDAQPCRRFVWRNAPPESHAPNAPASGWREIYVRITPADAANAAAPTASAALTEVEYPCGRAPSFLPQTAPALQDGYRIDAPLAARTLLDQLAQQPWRGLFLAFDYGKTWAELSEATPQGTARAYTAHRQSADLLAAPGQQDLTCHVCWDWLRESLAAHHFADITLDSQEAFFVKNAGPFIAAQIAPEAHRLSPRKQALLQLLHPAHLGQKFQVLHAKRL